MIGRSSKYVLWPLGFLLAVSALQYLWIAFFWYPGDLSRWRAAAAKQKPVHIRIKCTDQFGKPATNFRLKIKVVWISWYDWLFPLWAQHESTYQIETDHNGKAKFAFLIRKAYSVQFKEGSTNRYIFPSGKEDPYVLSFNNNPTGPLDMAVLNRTGQVIDMRVLRHDPPVKLTRYRPKVPGQAPAKMHLHEIKAQDEMVFTVDVMGNKFLEGRQVGDIVITVKNAKTACKMFTKIYTSGLDYKEEGEWDVSFKALDGTGIQRAESGQYVTFAPKTGYKKRLNYRMAIEEEMSRPEVAEFKGPDGGLWKVVRSTPDEDAYSSIDPQELFGANLYLRHDNPRWYGVVNIRFDLAYREGKLIIRSDGAYNPNGSTNLWTGSAHVPEGYY